MKNVILCFVLLFSFLTTNTGQVDLAAQSFEGLPSDNWTFSETPTFGSFSNPTDIWDIVTTLTSMTTMPSDGSMFVGGQDIENGDNLGGEATLNFDLVPTTGFSSVQVLFDFQASAFDGADHLYYTVTVDGVPGMEVILVDGMNGGGVSASGTETILIPDGSSTVELDVRIVQNGASDRVGLDNFKVTGIVIVPISLKEFKGVTNDENIDLYWKTLSESNNDHFKIERSSDKINFTSIGRVSGNGTTFEEQDYSFVDRAPKAGMNYYRLVQFDFNGDMEYHKTIAVENRTSDITVYPTLVKTDLVINSKGVSKAQVLNQVGSLVSNFSFENNHILNVQDLTPGIYFLKVESNGHIETHRFIRQ